MASHRPYPVMPAATPVPWHGVASAYTRSEFSYHAQYPGASEPPSGHRVPMLVHIFGPTSARRNKTIHRPVAPCQISAMNAVPLESHSRSYRYTPVFMQVCALYRVPLTVWYAPGMRITASVVEVTGSAITTRSSTLHSAITPDLHRPNRIAAEARETEFPPPRTDPPVLGMFPRVAHIAAVLHPWA